MSLRIERVPAALTRPLRQAVLRPAQRIEELVYPGDDDVTTDHFAAIEDERVVGISSIFHEPPRGRDPDPLAWRLRAMAVDPSQRGRGLGALLLDRCIAAARDRGATLLWCDAREVAVGFYAHHGFVADGPRYELPHAGWHRYMALPLARFSP